MALSVCRNNNTGVSADEADDRNNCDDRDERDILADLRNNVGRVITVFTESGGCSGSGFTGLLVRVDRNFIKLTTSLPSAPRHPFGFQGDFFDDRDRCGRRLGTVVIIPIRQIVAFCFNEI